jgi:zinc transport system ATP-binding protein
MKKNKPLVKLNNAGVYRDEKWLVKGISLEINKKEIVTLIGPNGSGKTTTGKLILDILQPDEGSVSLNTKQIAYVPQKINIDWAIPLRVIDFMNITSKLDKSKIIQSLELTGVDHLIYKNLLNLSGGEFQRVMIARSIAKKPELLILDEPVQGVDFNGEIKLYNLIKEISDKLKCGILLISHDIHFVMSSTDHVICLNGHVCCSGTPNDVAKNPAYIELFGENAAAAISLYRHDHNHTHNQDGSISK